MCPLDCDTAEWVKSLAGKSYNLRWIKPQDLHGGRSQFVKFSSTHVYSYNTYYTIPTYLYIHICTFKIQQHLISPTLNWFLHCAFFILQGHGQNGKVSLWWTAGTDNIHTPWLVFTLFHTCQLHPFVIHSVSMATEAASLNSVCRNSSSGLPRPSDAQRCSICTTTPRLLALGPGHAWHLVSLDQECPPGLCHMLHA